MNVDWFQGSDPGCQDRPQKELVFLRNFLILKWLFKPIQEQPLVS